MSRNYHFINVTNSFEHLFTFLFGHEVKPLLFYKPVVIVQNHEQFVAQGFRCLKIPDMSRMDWVKSAGYGHDNWFVYFHCCTSWINLFVNSFGKPIIVSIPPSI